MDDRYDLTSFSLSDMVRLGSALRHVPESAASVEEAANLVVGYLHEHLVEGTTGGKASVLVRFYRTQPLATLNAGQLEFVHARFGDRPAPAVRCLTLLATRGTLPEWCDTARSRRHRVIPLPSPDVVQRFPMLTQLVSQLGLGVGELVAPDPQMLLNLDQRSYGVFHVAEAAGSPYVPDQNDFVHPFGVASVLGFGGVFPTGDLFAIILFSRTPILRETAEMFASIALSVKVGLLPFLISTRHPAAVEVLP